MVKGPDAPAPGGVSRRDALLAAGGLAVGAASAALLPRLGGSPGPSTTNAAVPGAPAGSPVDPTGGHQAGIARPSTPQQHTLVAVLDFADRGAPTFVVALEARLAAVTAVILSFAGHADPSPVAPDGAGDLSVTLGLGSALVSALDPRLPGAAGLPLFVGDDAIATERLGGDVLVGVCAENPGLLSPALAAVISALETATVRWQQLGFRSPGEGTIARNPLGYHDGVIVPRGDAELDRDVWIPDGPAAGGTICVVRQLRLDVAAFAAEAPERQDEIMGRRRGDGAPLSGGGPLDEVNLRAKTESGRFVTPSRSHARAAHPSFTGSHLMLRRGYAYANGPVMTPGGRRVDDQGLLFICFQRELDDFTRTQRRLDELDDLMGYATPVASGAFLVLPGFTARRPLGSGLFP